MTSIQNIITELNALQVELDDIENIVSELKRLDLDDLKNMRNGIAGSVSYIAGGWTGKKYVDKYQVISSEQSKIFSNIDEIKNYLGQLIPWFEKLLTSDQETISKALNQTNFNFYEILKNLETKWIEIKKVLLNTEKIEQTLIRDGTELTETFKIINAIFTDFNNLNFNNDLSSIFKNLILGYLNNIFKSDKVADSYSYLTGVEVLVKFLIGRVLSGIGNAQVEKDKIKIFESILVEILNNKNVLYYIKDEASAQNILIKIAQNKKIEGLKDVKDLNEIIQFFKSK